MKNLKTAYYDRVAPLNDVVIVYPEFEAAFIGIQQCVQRSKAFGEPIGSVLTGDGGLGKTTVCYAILNQMPSYTRTMDGYTKKVTPAFYIEVPSPITVKSLAAAMLKKLGDPVFGQGTAAQLTDRLIHFLRECETELVFLDEFHHLFDRNSTSAKLNINVINWLKNLVNETKISFCLVGLPEFVTLLDVDSQIARRFQYRFRLKPLSLGSHDHHGTLYPFLNQIAIKAAEKVNVSFDPPLDCPLFAMQIYVPTKGFQAYVMALIRESIVEALANGREVVTPEDFSQIWKQGISSFICQIATDPFQMSMTQLATYLRGNV